MSNPCLYMFVATHLESMNMGKAMAQASHCANAFVADNLINTSPFVDHSLIEEWMGTLGFGTQVCLTSDDFESTFDDLEDWAGQYQFTFGSIIDPTYPFEVSPEVFKMLREQFKVGAQHRNGRILCTRPEMTAFYVFGDRDDPVFASKMKKFKRHP